MIEEDEKENFDEDTIWNVDTLNSISVVGPGERTLLPGHVGEPGHHGGLKGVGSVMIGPVDDPLPSTTPWVTFFGESVEDHQQDSP